MIKNHNKKLVFGIMITAFICLSLCTAVSAETVNAEYYESNTQLYGEHGLILAETFDASSIQTGYSRTMAQSELGNALYNAEPEIHDEIIQAYHAQYPILSQPTDGITYVYTYGDRLELTIYEDGSLGLLRKSVDESLGKARVAGQTDIYTVEYVDRDFFLPAHTTVRMSAWFEYDQQTAPICHLVELTAISHNGDRTSDKSHLIDRDQLNKQTTLIGLVNTYKVNGDADTNSYTLEIVCTAYGVLDSSASKA